jgi:hypothetical protein
LKNSRNLSTLELEKLVNEKGAELPDALSVLTLAVVTYVSSSQNPPTRLYRDRPRTYTVCFGNLEDKKVCKLIAGGFTALKGISVHYNCCKAAYKGAGAMRKL